MNITLEKIQEWRAHVGKPMVPFPDIDETNQDLPYIIEYFEKKEKKERKAAKKAAKKAEEEKLQLKADALKEERKKQEQIRKEQKAKEKAARKAEEKRRQFEEEKQEARENVIRLLARRDMLKARLLDLSPKKKKDAKRIADINIELQDIDEAINGLKEKYDIDISTLNRGNAFTRFISRAKNAVGKFVKKTKKFFKRNSELIVGLASVIGPVLVSAIIATIGK